MLIAFLFVPGLTGSRCPRGGTPGSPQPGPIGVVEAPGVHSWGYPPPHVDQSWFGVVEATLGRNPPGFPENLLGWMGAQVGLMGIGPLMGYPHNPQSWDGTQPTRAAPQLCPLARGPLRRCSDDAEGKKDGMGDTTLGVPSPPPPRVVLLSPCPSPDGWPCSPPGIPCVPACSPTAPCPLPGSALFPLGR